MRCSVMSVSQTWLGRGALKSRWTRSSWTGSGTLPRATLLGEAREQPLGGAQTPHATLAHSHPLALELVGEEAIAEGRVVAVRVDQGVGEIGVLVVPGRAGTLQPAVVALGGNFRTRQVTVMGMPSSASSRTSG